MIRAFTGPSALTPEQTVFVWDDVEQLLPVDEVRTGAAFGVDTVVATAACLVLPDARHFAFVPAAPHNGQVYQELPLTVVRCRRARTTAQTYRWRNETMLNGEPLPGLFDDDYEFPLGRADELVAYVREDRFYRSGEWMTINIALRLGVRVDRKVLP